MDAVNLRPLMFCHGPPALAPDFPTPPPPLLSRNLVLLTAFRPVPLTQSHSFRRSFTVRFVHETSSWFRCETFGSYPTFP